MRDFYLPDDILRVYDNVEELNVPVDELEGVLVEYNY